MLVEEPKIVPISSNNTHFQGYADRCRKQRERGSLNEKPNAYFPETYTLELIKFHKTHHIGNHTSQSQAIDGQDAPSGPAVGCAIIQTFSGLQSQEWPGTSTKLNSGRAGRTKSPT